MIYKELENVLILSSKKKQNNELSLILLRQDLGDFFDRNGEILKVGLNEEDKIVIQGFYDDTLELVSFLIPVGEDTLKTIKIYNITNIELGVVNSADLDEKIIILFDGLLKL